MFYYIFITLTLFLVGCSPKEESTERVIIRETFEPTPAQPIPQGPTDSGGGHGLNGKPLESFIKKLTDVPAFKNFVQPMLRELFKKHENLAVDLHHISSARSWYFVPTDLKDIPSYFAGAQFKTEQLAIHRSKEIWINSVLFEKMKQDDVDDKLAQEKLLIHELVMGVLFMQFQPNLDKCLAASNKWLLMETTAIETAEMFQINYDNERNHCRKNLNSILDLNIEKKLSLSENDYSVIRSLTQALTENLESLTTEELEIFYTQLNRRN